MKTLLVLVLCSLSIASAKEAPSGERWYQEKVAAHLEGKMEVRVPDGRVDVLTETHAIEVERAAKWKQAIGQSLWYAMQTGKKAGIVIIIEDELRDTNYAIRLESLIEEHKLPIKVWRWPGDFRGRGASAPTSP